jgi:hypothetical protein
VNDPYRTPGEIERDIVIPQRRDWGELTKVTFWVTFFIAFALVVVSAIAYPLFKAITSDGKADYCYVVPERWTTTEGDRKSEVIWYGIRQHVPWGSDRTIASGIKTTEEVRKEAVAFGCPIR